MGSCCECTKMSHRFLFLLNVTNTFVFSQSGRTFSSRNFEAVKPWEMWMWVGSKVTSGGILESNVGVALRWMSSCLFKLETLDCDSNRSFMG